ncbi:MAG: hypothetical protein J2P57_06865, partial [Acidimicrobiaceae bacterium]|nr:hypothetical protein [Acidimicrobiaceae bacterium]
MPQLDTPIAGVIGGFRLPRLHPDVTLRELCRVLAAPGVNGAIVEAPGIPVTVVTAVDVVRAVARGASLDDTTAGEIAPAHPAQVHAGTPAISAVTTMA